MEESNKKKISILYVGSDANVINYLKSFEELFDLIHVENGLAAITALTDHSYIENIVCEDTLPGLNGIGLFNMIRSKFADHKLPFIIISFERSQALLKKGTGRKSG
jgi:CheY-like chemotaxis protein